MAANIPSHAGPVEAISDSPEHIFAGRMLCEVVIVVKAEIWAL
jgi:hypothetical protein